MKKTKDWLTRQINFVPGYDKRPQYGIHGMHIYFSLRNPMAAVELSIHTGWCPSTVEQYWSLSGKCKSEADSYGITWHSPVQLDEYQTHENKCDFVGSPCWGSHFGLKGELLFKGLVDNGEDWLWQELEKELGVLQQKIEEVRRDVRNFS